jgi:hypothetical protein
MQLYTLSMQGVVNNCRFRVFMNFVVDCTIDYNFTSLVRRQLAPTHDETRLVSSRWERPVSISAVRIPIRQFKNKDAWKR